MKRNYFKLFACLFLALCLLAGCVGTPTEEASKEQSVESLEPAEIVYEYMLGLKSFTASEGVYTANGFTVKCEDEALKIRASALFDKGGSTLNLVIDESFKPENAPNTVLDQAYKIEVGDSVTVTARSSIGLYYGAMTVSRYIKAQRGMSYGTYIDWPDVAERCLHLDIARKYYPKEWIIEMIRSAAAFNINAVELHFSENEGFRIQCDTDPAIVSDEYLTKDEVKEIMAAANEVYVEIIPAFDSPGHLMQILSVHPEYSLTDVDGYNSPKTLDITNPKAVSYMKSLLDEYAELFKDCEKFSIGGDESFGWSDVKRMQFSAWQVLKDHAKATYGDGANAHDAFVGYINDIAAYMKAKGFKVRAWNDGLMRTRGQAAVVVPDKDIEVLYWTNNGTLRATDIDEYVDGGYNLINVNEPFMYYVLKEGFEQPKAKEIYEGWHSGVFSNGDEKTGENYLETPYELGDKLKGAYFCIWSDKPETQTIDTVMKNSRLALRAMAVKSWNYAPKVDYYAFIDQQKLIYNEK